MIKRPERIWPMSLPVNAKDASVERKDATTKSLTDKAVKPTQDRDSSGTSNLVGGLVMLHCKRLWPSFKESKLTSWLSTVINSTIRDYNDIHESDIPEDFDFQELLACWYPVQPWTSSIEPMC